MPRLTDARLEEILARSDGVNVTVVGDVMLDVYLAGAVTRISPEAPVPVVRVTEERFAIGGAANVAANVAALGASCQLVGCVGADAAGLQIRAALDEPAGGAICARLVEHARRPTTTKTRVMARHQQVVRFDRESEEDLDPGSVEELLENIRDAVASADVLILEDYNKGVLSLPVIRGALAAAEAAGVPTVVDPKFRHFFDYRGATVFKPNALELSAALGTHALHTEDAWLEEARQRLGCTHLLLTLGEEGMALRSAGEPTLRIPAEAREVFDVSGAGDTVVACLAVALGAGATMEEAATLANTAAGIGVGKPGVAVVSPDELRRAVVRMGPEEQPELEPWRR